MKIKFFFFFFLALEVYGNKVKTGASVSLFYRLYQTSKSLSLYIYIYALLHLEYPDAFWAIKHLHTVSDHFITHIGYTNIPYNVL